MKLIVDDDLIIGLDGGATKINGGQIHITENGFAEFGTQQSECQYADVKGFQTHFEAVPVQKQFQQCESGSIQLTGAERKQGTVWVQAAFDVVQRIAEKTTKSKVLVGIGMPGLKTDDGHGIILINNGPRIPDYAYQLESKLKENGIHLIAPIFKLGSDADYCGIGENYASDGLFYDVQNAYYLGGGTGVADALKLNGELIPFDQTKPWIAKSWEMLSSHGKTFEQMISAKHIVLRYGELQGIAHTELQEQKIYAITVVERAMGNDESAKQVIKETVDALVELLFERIQTIAEGSSNKIKFANSNRSLLDSDHPFIGTTLDRIIIGQRLSNIWEDKRFFTVFRNPVEKKLALLIRDDLKKSTQTYYLDENGFLKSGLIRASQLRDAPVLGAAVDAFRLFIKEQ